MTVKIVFTALLLCSVFITHADFLKFSSDTFMDLAPILNDGRQQLESISAKTRTPQFGECWTRAVAALETGCRYLTEKSQSALALRLTDCFLQMSGQGPILCDVPRHACLKQLSDRAFNAYTEFYTHTQNICYFLQSKLWHEEAERTIDKLASTSMKVSSQLADAERSQDILLKQQKESLYLQEDLGINLKASRETVNILMDDLRKSTADQKEAIVSLFEQLATLQSWLVGEVSWFDSIFFYSSTTLIVFLFTSSSRTQRARLLIYILLTINYLFERYLANRVSIESGYIVKENLNMIIWWSRYIFLALSFVTLLFVSITYHDYSMKNYRLLLEIKMQNIELIKWIRQNSTKENSCNKFESVSHINSVYKYAVQNDKNSIAHIKSDATEITLGPPLGRSPRVSVDVESNASRQSDSASDRSNLSVRRSVRLMKQ